ncbi:MAG: hypothetical protein KA210_04185 [Bacteroidia bacterium]|nr:hypothetical protein [Bacteroidia bacterium]
MKFLIYVSLAFMLFFISSCTDESNFGIEFCTEINGSQCVDSSADTFERGVRVYVILNSKTPIKEEIIIGNIYRMQGEVYDDYLGSKNFKINPNTYKVKHFIPFDQLGGSGPHLVEFTKKDGTLLISKELFIK